LTAGIRDGGNFSATDRTYVARVVASRQFGLASGPMPQRVHTMRRTSAGTCAQRASRSRRADSVELLKRAAVSRAR